MKKFNQLNIIQRSQLQILLKEKNSLSDIAKIMNIPRQTLYRELMRNSYTLKKDKIGFKTSCVHFDECRKLRQNKGCMVCHPNCERYEPGKRDCLKHYPFVCNNCNKRAFCCSLHVIYDPENASNSYHTRISQANAVPKKEDKIIKKINKIVSPLIKKGHSVEAILMNHPEIKVSSLTIRNWIKKGYLDCKFSELRMTGRRVSKSYDYSSKPDHLKLSEAKIGHKYVNYLLFKKMSPNTLTIQIDSVIGTKDGKQSVLTIHIVEHKFQFGILLENKSSEEVFGKLHLLLSKLKNIENETGLAVYTAFTDCWLTDNGVEFDRILDLTNDYQNLNIFFCHPNSSFEKGSCERNHVHVRYIHYKGWSFDDFTQEEINTLFSNIDSYPRKSINKKTPYQSVLEDTRLGREFLDLIGIYKVDCDDVILNPSLLKKIKT